MSFGSVLRGSDGYRLAETGKAIPGLKNGLSRGPREELASHVLGAICQLTWLKKKVMLGNNKR